MNLVPFLLPLIMLTQAGRPPAPPKLTARLYLAHAAVNPGGRTDLAVEVEIEKPWHIYHPILLSAGLPTRIEFDLPAGLSVGPVRYPTPILGETLGSEFLGYEERAAFLVELSVAASVAAGSNLPIKARVRALACTKEGCVPISASAAATLPVADALGPATHEKLFDDARQALPRPLDKAPYLKDSRLAVSHERVPVKGSAEIAAVIRIEPGHHIQARDPGIEGLIPARLFIESTDGITFGDVVWPEAKRRHVPGVGSVREYSGEVAIRARFQITDTKFPAGPVTLRVLFQYQACTDAGTCFAPEMAEGFVRFEVVPVGTAVARRDDPVFQGAAASPGSPTASESGGALALPPGLLWVFIGAFIGGVILNIMPCVLPVISLKIFSFMQQAGEEPGRVFRMGLVYGLGIECSFLVLAIIMVALRAPWGALMQYPSFVIALCGVVLALALSLLGLYELRLPGSAMSAATTAASREGYAGAFFNGILATALATPCTAPFLGSALGILAQLPPLVMGAGILTVGLGLAAPYVLLTAFPAWLRFLPKPGSWMVTFKEVLGLVLLVVLLWLLSILVEQVETPLFLGALVFLVGVGTACWLLGRLDLNAAFRRTVLVWVGVVAALVCGWFGGALVFARNQIPWQRWEPGIGPRLASEGYTAFIDYTATWCLTCQTNKRWVLETKTVRRKLEELHVVPIKADFTRFDPEVKKELNAHGRNGVPLNLIFPAGKADQPIVLPELLTKSLVLEKLTEAGPSEHEPILGREP